MSSESYVVEHMTAVTSNVIDDIEGSGFCPSVGITREVSDPIPPRPRSVKEANIRDFSKGFGPNKTAREATPDLAKEMMIVGQTSLAGGMTDAGSASETTGVVSPSSDIEEVAIEHLSPIGNISGAVEVVAPVPVVRGTITRCISLTESTSEPSNVGEARQVVASDLAEDEEMVVELFSPIRGVASAIGTTLIGETATATIGSQGSLGFGNLCSPTSSDVWMLHDFVGDLDIDRVDLLWLIFVVMMRHYFLILHICTIFWSNDPARQHRFIRLVSAEKKVEGPILQEEAASSRMAGFARGGSDTIMENTASVSDWATTSTGEACRMSAASGMIGSGNNSSSGQHFGG
ncbi:hypothetical protein ACLOJK_023049 [Asimina triloba]